MWKMKNNARMLVFSSYFVCFTWIMADIIWISSFLMVCTEIKMHFTQIKDIMRKKKKKPVKTGFRDNILGLFVRSGGFVI